MKRHKLEVNENLFMILSQEFFGVFNSVDVVPKLIQNPFQTKIETKINILVE